MFPTFMELEGLFFSLQSFLFPLIAFSQQKRNHYKSEFLKANIHKGRSNCNTRSHDVVVFGSLLPSGCDPLSLGLY